MILFFDTETTGLMPGRIIQLSYIMVDGEGVRAKNFFFAVEYIEPASVAVHGFTPEKLAVLSGGHTFSTDEDEIFRDFYSADLIVAHNFAFDLNFMIAEFGYLDRIFRYRESLCTMKYFTPILKLPRKNSPQYKYPKLTELAEFFEIYPYDVSKKAMELFGDFGKEHDARYDTAELYLCFSAACESNEDVKNVYLKYLVSQETEGGNNA